MMTAFTTLGDGIAALRREQRPVPSPGRCEVLVRMTAAALNYCDLLLTNGVRSLKPAVPRVPVSDGVGVVAGVGDQVTLPGGGSRRRHLQPELGGRRMHPREDGRDPGQRRGGRRPGGIPRLQRTGRRGRPRLSDRRGGGDPARLGGDGLERAHPPRPGPGGDRVLIEGTGGVSTFALLFARALGAEPIVLSSSDEKLERARALGAATTVNYKRTPDWEEEVLALTGGRGVDHVIEVVGGENLNRSLKAVRVSGTICFIGALAGPGAHVNTLAIAMKNVGIQGVYTGSREMFEEMNGFLASRRLRPVIDRTYGFSEFPEALTYLASGQQFGKVTIGF